MFHDLNGQRIPPNPGIAPTRAQRLKDANRQRRESIEALENHARLHRFPAKMATSLLGLAQSLRPLASIKVLIRKPY